MHSYHLKMFCCTQYNFVSLLEHNKNSRFEMHASPHYISQGYLLCGLDRRCALSIILSLWNYYDKSFPCGGRETVWDITAKNYLFTSITSTVTLAFTLLGKAIYVEDFGCRWKSWLQLDDLFWFYEKILNEKDSSHERAGLPSNSVISKKTAWGERKQFAFKLTMKAAEVFRHSRGFSILLYISSFI